MAQICAALVMMIGGGLYLSDIGDPFGTGLLGLGFLAIPASVVITLSVINAFNFVDGIDGLAASMALIALSAGALTAGLRAPALTVAALACGAILGFLPFNFPLFANVIGARSWVMPAARCWGSSSYGSRSGSPSANTGRSPRSRRSGLR